MASVPKRSTAFSGDKKSRAADNLRGSSQQHVGSSRPCHIKDVKKIWKNEEIKKEIKQFQQKKLCQVHFRRRWRTSAHPSHIKRYQENMKKNITKNRKTTSRNKKNCKVHLAKAGICGGHLHILATLFWHENVRRENRDSQTRNSQNAEIKQYNHVVPKISLCLLLSGGTKYGWFSYWWGLWLVTNWQWIKKISG